MYREQPKFLQCQCTRQSRLYCQSKRHDRVAIVQVVYRGQLEMCRLLRTRPMPMLLTHSSTMPLVTITSLCTVCDSMSTKLWFDHRQPQHRKYRQCISQLQNVVPFMICLCMIHSLCLGFLNPCLIICFAKKRHLFLSDIAAKAAWCDLCLCTSCKHAHTDSAAELLSCVTTLAAHA